MVYTYKVKENCYEVLKSHACDCAGPDQKLDWCSSARLREQLLDEIHALNDQLQKLQTVERAVDFSLQQTCREMIQSRQSLYRKIRR
jgi:hypothetical protein